MLDHSPDFEEFLQLLNEHNVRYLVVGGYAFAIHAYPRFTNDLDIRIQIDESNAERVLAVLRDFGFEELEVDRNDLTSPDKIIQIGNPPLRIDILTSIEGVRFEKAWQNKLTGQYGEQTIYFISRDDFVQNKRAAGREKDLRDLRDLEDME